MTKKICFAGFILLCTTALLAHPHMRKTVTIELAEGVKATVSYQTTPANETLAQEAEIGAFVVPRGPRLELSGEVKAGSVTLPAGEYTIGVIKNSASDWTMGLYPGQLGRRDTPDMSKVIKLDSMFSSSGEPAAHMEIDIKPGHGKFEGKAVLTILFGKLSLSGALS